MNARARMAPATCDVTVSRVFDAPRALVFRMWTDPEHLTRWWGPRDYTNPVCEIDARTGGAIFVHMQAPDGRSALMSGTFREIVAGERIVLAVIVSTPNREALFEGLVTATFEDDGDGTKVTVREEAVAIMPAAAAILANMENNWCESLRRLAASVSPDGRERAS